MSLPRKVLAFVAMGTALVTFSGLRAATSGDRAMFEGGGPACGDGAGRSCCPGTRGTIVLAQRTPKADAKAAPKARSKASPASMAKGVATRKAFLDQVSSLFDDGVASCCIDPGCALCVIAADACPCAGSLVKRGPVCPECWGGWQAGQGMLPDVKPEKIQILPKDQLKKLYDMRAEKLEQADAK